jgi:hypothetical protein
LNICEGSFQLSAISFQQEQEADRFWLVADRLQKGSILLQAALNCVD